MNKPNQCLFLKKKIRIYYFDLKINLKKNENNCIITSYRNFMYKLSQNMIN